MHAQVGYLHMIMQCIIYGVLVVSGEENKEIRTRHRAQQE